MQNIKSFRILFRFLCGVVLFLPEYCAFADMTQNLIYHDIRAKISPKEHLIEVQDRITLPEGFPKEFIFYLHSGLQPKTETMGVILKKEKGDASSLAESYSVALPGVQRTFILNYKGLIEHPLESVGKEEARGFSSTPGIISDEGVFLAGSSFWYPTIDDQLLSFTLDIGLPYGWDAVSQGERILHQRESDVVRVQWDSPEPQDEIFIVAAPFTEYTRPAGSVLAMAFLRTPDKELADKYLDATTRYIEVYEKLIGPYPYKKFALVENFWETGFGMPSFTLLGSKIIRFPFIINSSYPHEILHDWWGNSVFPDYAKGNWSEGLTAYLSDHLIKEQQGNGVEYRETTLQKYADYVVGGRDFPLVDFRSRHGSPSEAVGYGKSLMFFHMLRRELGDKSFIAGLQDFYDQNKFRFASFNDLRKSLERASGKDLKNEFEQWTTRAGGPEIRLRDAKSQHEGEGYLVTGVLEQVQEGKGYHLGVPIAITMEGQENAYETVVNMEGKHLDLKILLPSRPLRIDVDPQFDLFRRLKRDEVPPAISQALGAKKMVVILPSLTKGHLMTAYRKLAKTLGSSGPDEIEVKFDIEMEKLPSDSAVTILGWQNRFLSSIASALSPYGVVVNQKGAHIEKTEIPHQNHSVVLTARNPENKDLCWMFIASDKAEALKGLGRKLPHYHKYSYLGFEGDEPENIAKGRWPILDSPMTAFFPAKDGKLLKVGMGMPVPRKPLAELSSAYSGERMMETVWFLSGDELGGRGFGSKGLELAAEYIAEKFREAGLKPAGDREGSYFQVWEEKGGFPEQKTVMKNVVGIIPGKKKELNGQNIVVGAHYDHLGLGWPDAREGNKGKVHHGADDNASGVAVLLELAALLGKEMNPDRTVVFVAFAGEEAGKKGSKYYVANQKGHPANTCIGMLNLDTVGRLGKRKLLVLGGGSAREWVHVFRGAGYVTGVEIEMVSEDLDSSGQTCFQEAGIPAVQLFAGPHPDYHRPTDTVDKIDPEGLARVASVAKEVIEYLANTEKPLTGSVKTKVPGSEPPGERAVTIGTIPDFSYHGKGYRLSGVASGSPAETAGLREGDVIIKIDSWPVENLKDLSRVLKSLTPGTRVFITFVRDRKEITVGGVVTKK